MRCFRGNHRKHARQHKIIKRSMHCSCQAQRQQQVSQNHIQRAEYRGPAVASTPSVSRRPRAGFWPYRERTWNWKSEQSEQEWKVHLRSLSLGFAGDRSNSDRAPTCTDLRQRQRPRAPCATSPETPAERLCHWRLQRVRYLQQATGSSSHLPIPLAQPLRCCLVSPNATSYLCRQIPPGSAARSRWAAARGTRGRG